MTTTTEPRSLADMAEELRAAVATHDAAQPPEPAPASPVNVEVHNTGKRRMASPKPETPAYILAAICIIGIIVLTLLNHSVPDILQVTTIGSLGIGGAITSPHGTKEP